MKDAGAVFGRGIKFPPVVGPDGRIRWSAGEENIREAIRIILMTEPGERLYLPEFGAGLGRFLFEPNTAGTRQKIQDRITRTLKAWESRIRVEEVTVDPDALDPQAAIAVIHYTLVATQAQDSMSLNVALGSS